MHGSLETGARRRGSRTAATQAENADRAEAGTGRGSIYEDVTARIIGELEAGRLPWVQPWGRVPGAGASPGLPRNAVTERAYSGVNVLILWGEVIDKGYPSQGWLTFRQAIAAGGAVRKGERGTTVVYADRFVPKGREGGSGEGGSGRGGANGAASGGDGSDTPRSIAFLKRFTVFNVAQCDGLERLAPDPAPLPECQIVPVAEQVIAASGVDFRIGGAEGSHGPPYRAFYAPDPDFVMVPPQPAFFEQINYYRTCLHELTHATGHPARLDRKLVNAFGSKDYAREELVAEMGSAFLCAALGIVPTVRHADYIGAWLEVLREDNKAIFRAASLATKAADWLLARHAAAQAQVAPASGAGGGQ